ncbi:MAG: GNAT family N-acetyltransferase [Oscillatoriales cyanobacterium C42_A2020_001]|nr:GNAT family N-acetyltransferase [Leptolyngbyaceae cyanobacterium C42_A2020_001]
MNLHTNHLNLRPCQMSDLNVVHQLWTEVHVRRFLFDDRPITLAEARSFLETSIDNFANHGYGIWLFFEHHNDRIAGFTGLLHASPEALSLIFGTQPHLWGRGYAREAAAAVLDYAFNVLELKTVVADVDEPNQASIRVLEALGMTQTGSAIANERPLLYYKIQI